MTKILITLSFFLGASLATAQDFPHEFQVEVNVSNQRVVKISANFYESSHLASTNRPDLVRLLKGYSKLNSHPLAPVSAKVVVYKLRAEGEVGFSPSFDRDNAQILAELDSLLEPQGRGCKPFKKGESLVKHLLGEKQIDTFEATAKNLALLIQRLSEETDLIDRHYFSRSCEVDGFSGIVYDAFFVDPTPYRGPDKTGYLVVHRHGWGE